MVDPMKKTADFALEMEGARRATGISRGVTGMLAG